MTWRDKLLSSTAMPADMGFVVSVLDALVAADDTISGATVFLPNGDVRFIDAELLRHGGAA
jgi:hypothetical protein